MKLYQPVGIIALAILCSCSSGSDSDPLKPRNLGYSISYTTIPYYDLNYIAGIIDFYFDWFVEENDGGLRGPYKKNDDHVVSLGSESRKRATVSYTASFVMKTFMDIPVAAYSYYLTDTPSPSGERIDFNVNNAIVGEKLGFPNQSFYFNIDSSPFSDSIASAPESLLTNDGLASIFATFDDEYQKINSPYSFAVDLDLDDNPTVTWDRNLAHIPLIRPWQATREINYEPFVAGFYNGLILKQLGVADTTPLSSPPTGELSIPSEFPADKWYMILDPLSPDIIITEIDPDDTDPIVIRPMGRSIDSKSIDHDARTVTITAPLLGTNEEDGRVDFASIVLGTLYVHWEIILPGDRLIRQGDQFTLHLPTMPGQLGEANELNVDGVLLCRLDQNSTYDEAVRGVFNRRMHPYTSHACASD